jgi:hypothetical protein
MSDFDTVLERLVTDPAFTAALAADPAAVLSGYDLSEDEARLLRSQVSAGDTGGERTVEIRTSKAGMMGLLSPLGLGGGDPTVIGRGVAHVSSGFESLSDAPTHWVGPGDAGFGNVGGPVDTGLADLDGHYGPAVTPTGEAGPAVTSTGEAGHHGLVTGGGMPAMDHLVGDGDQVATGYHPHIDADGDGTWDRYTAVRHADGSVDVYEDRNRDGIADFVGHDRNADGILESADYDHAFDGTADTHMTDTNGDGWMDTRTPENGTS